jgi:N-methylhydantoinase B
MLRYHQPKSLDDALVLLADNSHLKILAGGTDVYPAKTTRAGWGHTSHPDVLDMSRIPGLRGIVDSDDHWSIGAMTTWTDIVRADLPPLFDGLKAAAREVGGIQIQNRGTLAGNICNASPAADGVPPLLTLGAAVEIASRQGMRREPLTQFIDGYRHTTLAPHELVTGLRIPKQSGAGYFLKLGARRYLVISIAVAGGIFDLDEQGNVKSAKVAVGACSAVAQRLPLLEHAMTGRAFDASLVRADHFSHLHPIDDVRGTATYRQAAALQLVKDLITQAASQHRRAA